MTRSTGSQRAQLSRWKKQHPLASSCSSNEQGALGALVPRDFWTGFTRTGPEALLDLGPNSSAPSSWSRERRPCVFWNDGGISYQLHLGPCRIGGSKEQSSNHMSWDLMASGTRSDPSELWTSTGNLVDLHTLFRSPPPGIGKSVEYPGCRPWGIPKL